MANEQRQLEYVAGVVTSANDRGFKLDSVSEAWIALFWSNVERGEPDACWPWRLNRLPAGYGQVRVPRPRKWELAHRVAYVLRYGPIGPKRVVRHFVCDNPPCCNPAHLRAGTTRDNVADKIRKARHRFGRLTGEQHPSSRLTAEAVQAIRCNKERRSGAALARQYGVTKGAIYAIQKRRTWRSLEQECASDG